MKIIIPSYGTFCVDLDASPSPTLIQILKVGNSLDAYTFRKDISVLAKS